jgi:hypothetical protein
MIRILLKAYEMCCWKNRLAAQAGRPGINLRMSVFSRPIPGLPAWAVKDFAKLAMMTMPLLVIGCQPPTPSPGRPVDISAAPLPTNRPPTQDEAVASDLSASRLHDIVGAILVYYIRNHNRLPDTLEDVRPFADLGTELNFISPSSGLPYEYSAGGLLAAGQEKRIIVWDPSPNKQGLRWCILMPPMAPGKPIIPEVVPIQEKAFEAFVPAIQ